MMNSLVNRKEQKIALIRKTICFKCFHAFFEKETRVWCLVFIFMRSLLRVNKLKLTHNGKGMPFNSPVHFILSYYQMQLGDFWYGGAPEVVERS
jgi:hypothetical protein